MYRLCRLLMPTSSSHLLRDFLVVFSFYGILMVLDRIWATVVIAEIESQCVF
jgi:hypothetical protein